MSDTTSEPTTELVLEAMLDVDEDIHEELWAGAEDDREQFMRRVLQAALIAATGIPEKDVDEWRWMSNKELLAAWTRLLCAAWPEGAATQEREP